MSSNIQSASDPQEQVVVTFVQKTCRCLKWKGKPCSSQFSTEYLGDTRSSCFELQKNELDLLILGQLLALSSSCSDVTTDNRSPTPRERTHIEIDLPRKCFAINTKNTTFPRCKKVDWP